MDLLDLKFVIHGSGKKSNLNRFLSSVVEVLNNFFMDPINFHYPDLISRPFFHHYLPEFLLAESVHVRISAWNLMTIHLLEIYCRNAPDPLFCGAGGTVSDRIKLYV